MDDGFKVFSNIRGFKVGVKLLGSDVAKVLGVLGVVIAANSPGQLVFGNISRNKLYRVERVRFARLPGREHSVIDGLGGNL